MYHPESRKISTKREMAWKMKVTRGGDLRERGLARLTRGDEAQCEAETEENFFVKV